MKIDIAQLCNAIERSFDDISFDDLIIEAHNVLGLNTYRNHFNKEKELRQFMNAVSNRIKGQRTDIFEIVCKSINLDTKVFKTTILVV
jgi:hypothetical protein